ncbi:MAG TPA: class I SAM-dependent methyltransferase [Acidimicrobiales bacterium]|nr:class I SAM-dependent methyltransferase [Acidimicrobiales bacterium]
MTEITNPVIQEYAEAHTTPEPQLLLDVAAATRDFSPMAMMMVGRLEGRFLNLLVGAIAARRVLEIGTFTGYSALAMAAAMPADGRIVSCEVDPAHAEFARGNIASSPFASMIEVRLGPAIETVRSLEGPFDFVFIDADKRSYPDYYEASLSVLRSNGLMVADNVLRSGRVLDLEANDPDIVGIKRFNEIVVADARVECAMLPIRDGVTLIRKL